MPTAGRMRRACAAGEIKITGMVTMFQCSFKFPGGSRVSVTVVGLKLFRRRRVRAGESESLQSPGLMDHGMAAPSQRLRITVVIATVTAHTTRLRLRISS